MKKIYILIIAIGLGGIVNAQWQPFGVSATLINALAVNGNKIFAGSAGNGVYTSVDNGSSWSVTYGFSGINSIAVKDSNVFMATETGVFLSTNNGMSWVPKNTGLSYSNDVYSLIKKDSNIFAGTDQGIFMSTNNGNSWVAKNTGLYLPDVFSFAIKDSILFASTDKGIIKSADNGNNWTMANTGLPVEIQNHTIENTALAVKDSCIFAEIAIWDFINGNSQYRSNLYLSTNNGDSWTMLYSDSTIYPFYAASIAIKDSNIFITTIAGILLSNNNGMSWTPINDGLTNLYVGSFAINDTFIFAGGTSLVYRRPLSDFSAQLTIATSTNPTIGGSTSGDGTYTFNQLCTIKAIPNSGYSFLNWKENNNIVSIDTNYTFNVTENRNLVADFTTILGIFDYNSNNLNIHPNPAKDNLIIELPQDENLQNTMVSIYDIQGQLLIHENIKQLIKIVIIE